MSFSFLAKHAPSLELPNEAWAAQVVDNFGLKAVIFSEMALAKSPGPPYLRKVLEVTPSSDDCLSVRTFVHGHAVTVDNEAVAAV